VGFGQRAVRTLAPRRNLAEEAQGIRLVAAFLVRTGMRPLGEDVCVLQAISQQLCFPQGETTVHLIAPHISCSHPFQRLHEQGHGVGDAPGEGVRRPQSRSHPREPERDVRGVTEGHGPFDLGERPVQVALAKEQQRNPP
jgi:hypothetical protein